MPVHYGDLREVLMHLCNARAELQEGKEIRAYLALEQARCVLEPIAEAIRREEAIGVTKESSS